MGLRLRRRDRGLRPRRRGARLAGRGGAFVYVALVAGVATSEYALIPEEAGMYAGGGRMTRVVVSSAISWIVALSMLATRRDDVVRREIPRREWIRAIVVAWVAAGAFVASTALWFAGGVRW